MMDAKYLAEIKARLDAGRLPMKSDMEALLAEAERLTEENEKMKPFYKIADDTFKHWENAAYAMRDEERAKNAVKDQQIDTLEKALELMSRTACGEVPGTMPEWDMIGCVPDKNCMKENPCKGSNNQCHECWMRYFIQQAQEQEAENDYEKS